MQARLVTAGWILMLIVGIIRIAFASWAGATGMADVVHSVDFATTGAAMIGISLGSYRKAEKWSWWCLLVVGLAPALACIIIDGISLPVVIGLILIILGLAIPAKAILGNKSAQSGLQP
jgi:hypothetical protein